MGNICSQSENLHPQMQQNRKLKMQSKIKYSKQSSDSNSEYSVIMPKYEDLNPPTDFPLPFGEIT